MPRSKSQVESALRQKGFAPVRKDHNYFVYINLDGTRTTIKTKTSHTKKMKDIPDNLLAQMAKQCGLSKSDFLKLVDCSLDQQQYQKLLDKKRDLPDGVG
jgi:predicted RNA binding protein YcfA (HicA-like mRNA interferase family)